VLLLALLLAAVLAGIHGTGATAGGAVLAGIHGAGVTAGGAIIAAQAMLGLSRPSKFLYRTSEAKAALGIGTSRLYELINNGTLDARRLGKRTYITAASLEAFVASLPPALTPTLMKAEHDRWSGRGKPRPDPQQDGAKDPRILEGRK
jgi:hypothetical protein